MTQNILYQWYIHSKNFLIGKYKKHLNILLYVKYSIIFGSIGVGFILLSIYFTPSLDITKNYSLSFYDRHHQLINHAVVGDHRSIAYTDLDQIPPFFVQMVLYREDRRFYKHFGIDIRGIVRSLYVGRQDGVLTQGASTIDQQLVKLLLGHHRRTLMTKGIEWRYALWINYYYTKDQILVSYINNIEFDGTTRGLAIACNKFYQTSCFNLNKHQLLYMRSQTKFPGHRDVSEYAYQFAQRISRDLPELYHIDNIKKDDFRIFASQLKSRIAYGYPHLSEYLLNRYHTYGFDDAIFLSIESGVLISSIDLQQVDQIQSILSQYQPYLHSKNTYDVCVVLMQDGKIRALNTMRDRDDPEGGMIYGCTRPRQVGSAIKPFVYALALHHLGYTGGSIIVDEPLTFFLDNGGKYEPKNFDMKYHGKVTIAKALGSSLNIPAVKILSEISIDTMRSFLKQISTVSHTDEVFDSNPYHYGLSLALGSIEISPIDFTKMYQIFTYPYAGLSIYKSSFDQIISILSTNTNRLISFPLENWFHLENSWVKSGTSRNFVDGWTCGGVKDYTMCIWVGNYNAKPTKDSGYNTAGVLRHAIVQMILTTS